MAFGVSKLKRRLVCTSTFVKTKPHCWNSFHSGVIDTNTNMKDDDGPHQLHYYVFIYKQLCYSAAHFS